MSYDWYESFKDQGEFSTFKLPFIPQLDTAGNFDYMTVALNATHLDGNTEYNLHNLYGHMMAKRTH